MSVHVNTATVPGRAFAVVREAFESTGTAIRMRGHHAFMASCPLHDDTTPSLAVTWKSSRSGKPGGVVLVHCFSCNAAADAITTAVGLRLCDLFDDTCPGEAGVGPGPQARPTPVAERPRSTALPEEHRWRRVRVYTYTTANGRPVQQVIRDECDCNGVSHKRFLQRYRAGRDWSWRKPQGFEPVLYRAAHLAAADADQWVWLTEGEKDADTAARLGLVATTNAQGANSFPPELAAALHGRKVAIIVDRDAAGYQRAANVHEHLQQHAAQTVVLLPAVNRAKADLTDHVEAGRWDTSQQFRGFIEVPADRLVHLHETTTNSEPARRMTKRGTTK